MEKWAADFVKNLDNRMPKKNNSNIYLATIESLNPFRATIENGIFELNRNNTITCLTLEAKVNLKGNFSLPKHGGNGSFSGKAEFIDFLKIGDNLVVAADSKGQKFFILGKAGSL